MSNQQLWIPVWGPYMSIAICSLSVVTLFLLTKPSRKQPIGEGARGRPGNSQSLSKSALAVMSNQQLWIPVWGPYMSIEICSLSVYTSLLLNKPNRKQPIGEGDGGEARA
jgi:hypothetical protein